MASTVPSTFLNRKPRLARQAIALRNSKGRIVVASESPTHRIRTIGVLVTTAASFGSRVSGAVTQVILGLYLTSQDFGLYGTALGVLGLTAIMRAGGVATYLPSMTPDEFKRDSGRLFGWSLLCIATGASLTAAVAEPVADLYGQPVLAWVLWILAARNLISAVSVQSRMRMAIDLRFAELAVLDTVISLSKLALSCLLAWWLDNTPYAVLALAVPYAAAAVIEMSYCLPASGITLDELTPHPRQLLRTAKDLKWSLALALMISLNSQTNLLAVSRIVPVAAVGFIFFAYQLATQPMIILSSSLTNVLATTMARERQNPAMERDTMQRIFVGAMLLVPFVFLGAIALYPSVESLVYRGRWAPAYWPFACLAGGFCFATVTGVMTGSLVGLRQFKRLAGFETLRAIGLIGGTYVGYQICVLAGLKLDLKPTPDQPPQPELMTAVIIISAATGAGIAVMACAQLWLILRRYRMSRSDIVRALTFGPLVALLTMISSQSIGNSLAVSFVPDSLHPLGLASLKLIIIGAIYTTVAVLCVRFLAEETLRRTVDVLPRRVREVCVRVLRF